MSERPGLWAIIPAAGSGRRLGSETAKQYLTLHGQAVLTHSVGRILAVPGLSGLVLVQAPGESWRYPQAPPTGRTLLHCTGGAARHQSVINGLLCLCDHLPADQHESTRVLVHDAARPCVRVADIRKLLEETGEDEAGGLLGMPVTDTLKRANVDSDAASPRISATVARDGLWVAQTPQLFPVLTLLDALRQADANGHPVTDEASAMEMAGHHPRLVHGSADNIKITWPGDLERAAGILDRQQAESTAADSISKGQKQ